MGAARGLTTRSFKSPIHLVPGPMMGFGAPYFFKSTGADLMGDDVGKGVSGDVWTVSSACERAPLNS